MILYSRHDCPLCEDVEQTLNSLKLSYEFVHIDLDENLRKQYHVRVPILVNKIKQELAWPFNERELKQFARK